MDLNNPLMMKRPNYSNPNLGRNGFAKFAQRNVTPFGVIMIVVVCLLKIFFTPIEPLVVHIALMTIVLVTAYFLGFNKPGIGRTGKHLGEGLRLALPVFVVGVPFLVLSIVRSGAVGVDHNIFDIAYYVLYFFAMCYLQDAVLCGVMGNLIHKTVDNARTAQQKLLTFCAVWSVFYVLNGPSNATIAQIFSALVMGFFFCTVYLRVQNLWAVVLAHGICYCMLAGMFLPSSAAYSILTVDPDGVTLTLYMALHAVLLIPALKNLQAWEADRKTAEARMLAEKRAAQEKKEKTVIRRGVKQKHNR